ncbi:S49 family peptidase [Paraburkholderia phymatum]|uniref:S49 family peptidase n=1 Tax=Paraburkholderia phymatum TaxID=148447 RepID=UPI001FCCBF63|nr:S49 family peptidase [Paraburkholderia phymatum]
MRGRDSAAPGRAGGVGVLVAYVDFSKALEGAGVTVTLIAYGKHKADAHETQPLADDARARIQADVNAVGEMFVAAVARYRGLSRSTVRAMQGATYFGREGIEAVLADAVAAPDEAFAALVHELDTPRAEAAKPPAAQRATSRRRKRPA